MGVLYTEQRTQLSVGGNGDAKGMRMGVMEVQKETQEGRVGEEQEAKKYLNGKRVRD